MAAAAADAADRLHFLAHELEDARPELRIRSDNPMLEQSRYRELFEEAPEGYVLTDRWGSITHANHAAAQLMNVATELLPGKPLAFCIYADDRSAFRRAVDQAKRNHRADITLRFSPCDKPTLIAHFTAATLGTDRQGTRNVIRWTIQDVTEQRAGEQRLADSRQQLGELAVEVSRAEERERRRIAVGIHDRVSQPLALAKMTLGRLRTACGTEGEAIIESAGTLLQQAIDESRSLTFELSPPVLYELGLIAAVEWLADQLHRQNGLMVKLKRVSFAAEGRLALDGRVMLFQAIRELLTNVVKHAQARSVTIWFSIIGNHFSVRVMDDGLGFNASAIVTSKQSGGFGLFSIRIRLEQIGGSLAMRSTRGRGSWTELVVPLQPKSAPHSSAAMLSSACESGEVMPARGSETAERCVESSIPKPHRVHSLVKPRKRST